MVTGDEIKRAREAKGWSQAKLAEHIGISQPAIKKIESGETARSRWIDVIVEALGISGHADVKNAVSGRWLDLNKKGIYPIPKFIYEKETPILYRSSVADNSFRPGSIAYEYRFGLEELVERPWFLRNSRSSYGIMIPDETLLPAFEPGDLLLIDPQSPKIKGKFHAFCSGAPDGLSIHVLLRRFLGVEEEGCLVEDPVSLQPVTVRWRDYPEMARVIARVER